MASYNCRLCEKAINSYNLKVHISLQHFNFLPFSCPKCDFKCHVDWMMTNHFLERGHGDHFLPIEPVECPAYLTTLISQVLQDSIGATTAVMPESLENPNLPTVDATALNAVAVEPKRLQKSRIPIVTTKTPKVRVVPDVLPNKSGTVGSSSSGSSVRKSSKLPGWQPGWIRTKIPTEDKSAMSSSSGSAKVSKPQRQLQEDEIDEQYDSHDDSSSDESGETPILRRKTEKEKSKATGVVRNSSKSVEIRKNLKVKAKPINIVSNKSKIVNIPGNKIIRSAKEKPISMPYEGIHKKKLRKELVNGRIIWTCNRCLKTYDKQTAAIGHLYSHSPSGFACRHCDRKFSHPSSYRHHLLQHQKIVPKFKCRQCGKKFTQRSNLTRHSFIHANVRFSCDQCEVDYSDPSPLHLHKILKHSGKVLPKHKCQQCGKAFVLKNSLYHHRLVHADATHFCDECPSRFRLKWDLACHKTRMHSD